MTEKKIVVTGSRGFIGSNLVRLFVEAGYYVIGIDKEPRTKRPQCLRHTERASLP